MLIKSRILAKDNRSRRGKNGTHARLKRISYPDIIDSKLKGFKGASRRNIRLKIFERYRSIVEIIREESEVGAARLLPPMEISLEDTRGDTRYTRRVEVILPYTAGERSSKKLNVNDRFSSSPKPRTTILIGLERRRA